MLPSEPNALKMSDYPTISLHLRWPPGKLGPNGSQGNWRGKADLKAVEEADANCRTRDLLNSIPQAQAVADLLRSAQAPLHLTITFYPPDRSRRDLDNRLAAMKGPIDGVFAALGIDDSQVKSIHIQWGEVCKGGAVHLDISQAAGP